MGLYKKIQQEDGVKTSYHRILFIKKTINKQNQIAVLSYIDKEARGFEKDNGRTPYCNITTYEVKYNDGMTVQEAYEYLKTLEPFFGAKNI